MYCSKCGKKVSDNAKYCSRCGKPMKGLHSEHVGNIPQKPNKVRKTQKHEKWFFILAFGISFAIIIFLGIKYYPFLKSENKNELKAYYQGFSEDDIRYEDGVRYVNSRLLVTSSEEASYAEIEKIIKQHDAVIIGYIELSGDYQVRFNKNKTYDELKQIAEDLKANDCIYDVTLECVTEISPESVDYKTDPWIASRHADDNSGKIWDIYLPDGANWWAEAIMMPVVWKKDINYSPVNVGLIDTYFDTDNEDLADAFVKDGIIGQDNIDVSALYCKALKEEIRGLESEISADTIAHGTVNAGIIGARNNGFGICGISQNADLYGVSLFGNSDNWNISTMCYKYGIAVLLEKNVKIISVSMGNDLLLFSAQQEDAKQDDRTDAAKIQLAQYSGTMKVFLKRCLKKYDFLIVKCAGNNSGCSYVKVDIDKENPYGYRNAVDSDSESEIINGKCDAKYDLFGAITDKEVADHIIVVGSIDLVRYRNVFSQVSQGYRYKISEFSNIGERVNIYAPGGYIIKDDKYTNIRILSDCPANTTEYMQGTSQATPMVAGVAALVWGINPDLSAKQVKQIIQSSAEEKINGKEKYYLLNAYSAVEKAQETKTDDAVKSESRALLIGYAYTTFKNDEGENEIVPVNAEITICSKKDGSVKKLDLDSDKAFSAFIDKGEYTINVCAENYVSVSKNLTVSDEQTCFFPIFLKRDIEGSYRYESDQYKYYLTVLYGKDNTPHCELQFYDKTDSDHKGFLKFECNNGTNEYEIISEEQEKYFFAMEIKDNQVRISNQTGFPFDTLVLEKSYDFNAANMTLAVKNYFEQYKGTNLEKSDSYVFPTNSNFTVGFGEMWELIITENDQNKYIVTISGPAGEEGYAHVYSYDARKAVLENKDFNNMDSIILEQFSVFDYFDFRREAEDPEPTAGNSNNEFSEFINEKRYLEYVQNWELPVYGYCIIDINQDGVNELILSSDERELFAEYQVYAQNSSNINLIKDFWAYCGVYYSNTNKAIAFSEVRRSLNYATTSYYSFDGIQLNADFDVICSVDGTGIPEYMKIPGKDIALSEEEYNAYLSELVLIDEWTEID